MGKTWGLQSHIWDLGLSYFADKATGSGRWCVPKLENASSRVSKRVPTNISLASRQVSLLPRVSSGEILEYGWSIRSGKFFGVPMVPFSMTPGDVFPLCLSMFSLTIPWAHVLWRPHASSQWHVWLVTQPPQALMDIRPWFLRMSYPLSYHEFYLEWYWMLSM